MADEPDKVVPRQLRDIRATLDEHSKLLLALPRIAKRLADHARVLASTLGQPTETQLYPSQQLLSKPEPA